MIRKIFRNTAVVAAAVAMILQSGYVVNATEVTTEAEQTGTNETTGIENTYNTTAVGGIDVAINAYLASGAADEEIAAKTAVLDVDTVTAAESSARYPQFENKLMADVTDYMNIRSEADAESEAVGKLPHGAVATVLERGDEWTKIESGSVTGYVKNEYVLFGDDAGDYAEENCDKIATVTTTTLKVREEASADSTCLTMIPEGETYEVISDEEEGWTKVLISDDFTGYVSNEFIDVEFDLGKAISKEEEEAEIARQAELARQAAAAASASQAAAAPASAPVQQNIQVDTSAVTGTRADVVNYALQFVGNPYVWGGTSLTNGCDCSGFTMSVYAHFGIGICHASYGQVNYGTQIGIYEVQPGDLLFYNNGGSRISHVALYIGNGQIVHASTERTGIIVSNAYYQTPCAATRLLP
ncbi:MAG: C40 family peptidase [Lachnospiraceae bacterium]|nr:C40 family peptidase [Lachnospiraceae bacterium]